MAGKIKYFMILLLALIPLGLSAQNSQVLYYMNLPQKHLINPAYKPSSNIVIGLPALSGINIGISNNFANFSDLFMRSSSSDSLTSIFGKGYNIDDFLAKIKDRSSISPQASVQLLGIGFPSGKDTYFYIDINDRIDGDIVFPKDLFRLALKGNEEFVGSTVNLSSLRGSMKYYREIGVAVSKSYSDKLRIGIRGKLLLGIGSAVAENNSLGMTVSDDYTHTLDADMTFNVSAPLDVYTGSDLKVDSVKFDDSAFDDRRWTIGFFSGVRNPGLGLDAGATYTVSDKITLSAALNDIGFIRWKSNASNFKVNGQFVFNGLNMVDVINGTRTLDEVGQELVDSLKNTFGISYSENPYTTWLSPGITLGGSYNLTKSISLGLLSSTRVINKVVHEALTISANVNLGNSFSASLGYTAANRRFDNIGAGLAFRLGVVQFYVLTDRIPVEWSKIRTDNSSLTIPANTNTTVIRIGLNLLFGNKPSEKAGIPAPSAGQK